MRNTANFALIYILLFIGLIGYFSFNNSVSVAFLESQPLYILQLSQALNSALVFLLPAYIFKLIFYKHEAQYFDLSNKPKQTDILYIAAVFLLSIPFIGFLASLNDQITFTGSLSHVEEYLRSSQEMMENVTLVLLNMKNMQDLLLNVFVIGFMAALTEEIFFRGMIQKYLNWFTKKPHLAIWITAIIFSGLHAQFYGFFPRMILGAVLGYVYFYSGNLWLPILGHFINNATQVVVSYVYLQDHSVDELLDLEIGSNSVIAGILSFCFALSLLLVWIRKQHAHE